MRLHLILVGFFLLTVNLRLSAAEPAGKVLTLPTFGLAIKAPAGWMQIPEGGPGMAARWAKTTPDQTGILAAITIEVEPLGNRTGEQHIQAMAKSMNARIVEPPTKLGNVVATRLVVEGPIKPGSLHRSEAIVAIQNRCAYVLGAMTTEGADVAADAETARASWTWSKPEPPSKHLALRAERFPALGRFMLNVPGTMRPFPIPEKDRMHLGLFNYQTLKAEFFTDVQVLPAPGGVTPEFRDKFGQQLHDRLKLATPVTWTTIPGQPVRYLSSTMIIPAGTTAPNEPAQNVRYGLVNLNDAAGLLSFTIAPSELKDQPVYESTTTAIMKSIAPLPERK